MKLSNLKYSFLISATTFFSGSTFSLYAQDNTGNTVKIEESTSYKQQFFDTISPENDEINVEFVVDSVKTTTSNAEFFADINVIELLAYLDEDSDEYQSYMASKHIVAHELWHRIAMLNNVLEKPMSATEFRTVQDNFEITASIAQLLTFREDYINEPEEKREELRNLEDPKVRMYIAAVENNIINPFSKNKVDFDFEMEFIAKTVSSFWQNNLSPIYAKKHNDMVIHAGRKEFSSPVYEKNFWRDIKVLNTIGGIDFSKYYNVKEVRMLANFEKGSTEDKKLYRRFLFEPDFEAWLNKKSTLKRYSRQNVVIPNFVAPLLVRERQERQDSINIRPYKFRPPTGSRVFPYVKAIFYTASELVGKNDTIIKIYPDGSISKIAKANKEGISPIISINYNHSFEKGYLQNGRKTGEFIYYDENKKEIARCTFKNGRAQNGTMVYAVDGLSIRYIYKNGKLRDIKTLDKSQKTIAACQTLGSEPDTGLIPKKDCFNSVSFDVYKNGILLADIELNKKNGNIKQWRQKKGSTITIKRFYDNGAKLYTMEKSLTPDSPKETINTSLKEAITSPLIEEPTEASLPAQRTDLNKAAQTTASLPKPSNIKTDSVTPDVKKTIAAKINIAQVALPQTEVIKAELPQTGIVKAELPQTAAVKADRPPTETVKATLPDKTETVTTALSNKTEVVKATLPKTETVTTALPEADTKRQALIPNDKKEVSPARVPVPVVETKEALYAPNGAIALYAQKTKEKTTLKVKQNALALILKSMPMPVSLKEKLTTFFCVPNRPNCVKSAKKTAKPTRLKLLKTKLLARMQTTRRGNQA